MHPLKPLAELLGVADEAVPELVLPNRPRAMACAIQGARRNPFDILNRAGKDEGKNRQDQNVPVIWHQHVPQKQKAQLPARRFDGRRHRLVFRLRKRSERAAPILSGRAED